MRTSGTEMKQTRLTWMIVWIIVIVIGAVVGWLVASSIFLIALVLLSLISWWIGSLFFAISAFVLVPCLVMGLAQALALYGSVISTREWFVATLAGSFLGWLVAGLAAIPLTLLLTLAVSSLFPIAPEHVGCGDDCYLVYGTMWFFGGSAGMLGIAWILLGLGVGCAQASLLRKRVGKSTWWVRATCIGWAPGMLMCLAVIFGFTLAPPGYKSYLIPVIWPLGAIAYGLFYGVATAIPLERLLRVEYSSPL